MIVLGITGGTGGGKTTLLGRVEAIGGMVIDCDAVYHTLLQTDRALLQAIGSSFPDVVAGGELSRRELGKLVFENASALADLNGITHGFVLRRVDELLALARRDCCKLAAVDAIALFESGLDSRCDVTVAVIAPAQARIRRLMAREGITEDYAKARIAAQKTDAEFARRTDWVLENDGDSAAAFIAQCDGFLTEIMGGTQK